MRFQVFGGVRVLADGQPVPLASRRQEQLLALLVSARGRPVSAGTLVAELWKEGRGARAGKNLQVLVHRLRRSLGDPGRIRHEHAGYRLVADAGEVDAWRFADLVERARAATAAGETAAAAELLTEALALWQGPAFAGLEEVNALAEAAERLEQSRKAALLERVDADLALGGHVRLIPELGALVEQDPLAEAVAARLMVAMYRSGQRAEALAVYRRTRAVLAEELGLEPGPQLRALERAILLGESDVEAFPAAGETRRAGGPDGRWAAPYLLPADVGDLTGREEELRLLVSALLERDGSGPVGYGVYGMPGVGKTALAVRAAHETRADYPDGQLYVNLRGAGPRPVPPREALGRFLRALGVSGGAIPDGLDERAEVFRARLARRRVLVVLDDAADEAQVEPLLPADPGCAVLITGRTALTALPAVRRLRLDVLNADDSIRLLQTITGRAELTPVDAASRRLSDLCGGLPLALRIAGARLAARPHWSVARLAERLAAEHDRLDELVHGSLSVRAGLALGYSGLSEEARTLFRRLALIETPDFAGWAVAALLDSGRCTAEDVLDRLRDAHLVEFAGLDGIGEPRYRLHDLVRLYAKERAAEEPRDDADAALARLVGGYLWLAERAHCGLYGGDDTVNHVVLHGRGTRWSPGTETTARLLADPAGWLRSERLGLVAAVGQAARLGLAEAGWDLALSAVTLFEAQGLFDDWRDTSLTALDAATRAGDLRGQAAMRYSLGTLELFRQRYGAARPHLDAAYALFDRVDDLHGQGLALRNAALIDRVEGRAEAALARYERALAMLREVRDRFAEAHVLGNMAQIHIDQGDPVAAAALLDEALALYRAIGTRRGVAQILNRRGMLYLAEGRAEEAEAVYVQVIEVCRDTGDRIGEVYGLLGRAEARLLAADHAHAGPLIGTARTLAAELDEPFLVARAGLLAGRLAAGRGCPVEAEALLDEAATAFADIGLAVWRDRALAALEALRAASR
jgi:DNA-binding SARP family transcriptional activator/tetratricopeptide (TPR) repeat protein